MLDLPRYLLGVAELLLLGGFAWLGASAVRARLLPGFSAAPAYLATSVVALALLIWTAELLGSFGLFEPVPYLVGIGIVGGGLWLGIERRRSKGKGGEELSVIAFVAFLVTALALVKFGVDVRSKLMTGMTGFDSTWYHGPFAAGFFQSGDTWSLHFIAPQFLAWFYPANAEIFHAAGMLAFGRDILSPLLNLGWFAGCLVACWCIGRPYRVAPWSLALGAIALSLPVLADQAGEARNDIVGIFFLLAAVAIALNASSSDAELDDPSRVRLLSGSTRQKANAGVVVGLAAGMAAGTKLNFLLPAAVLVLGLPLLAPAGKRLRALAATTLAALAGGGYWYLRNLVHTGNPLPWFDHLGPISLPAPQQALGGREGHTVLSYLTDGKVWSDWFLPGLHGALTILWPLVAFLALTGLLLSFRCSFTPNNEAKEQRNERGGGGAALCVAGLAGLAAALAWLVAPTSASGPEGMPRGFESGLRYLTPALVLGLALLPVGLTRSSIVLPTRLRRADAGHPPNGRILKAPASLGRRLSGRRVPRGRPAALALALVLLAAIAIGYPVQRRYLHDRYADPTFAAPGLNTAFEWANDVSNARIATTSTRQYPLFGRDLTNHVQYIGVQTPHGGFVPPTTCPQWRRLLNEGHYDYVVTTRDRVEPGKPPYPATAAWTAGHSADLVLATTPDQGLQANRPPGVHRRVATDVLRRVARGRGAPPPRQDPPADHARHTPPRRWTASATSASSPT